MPTNVRKWHSNCIDPEHAGYLGAIWPLLVLFVWTESLGSLRSIGRIHRKKTIWITVGQGPTFSPLSPSLWETARYRLKYCLKGPLNPKQRIIAKSKSRLNKYKPRHFLSIYPKVRLYFKVFLVSSQDVIVNLSPGLTWPF